MRSVEPPQVRCLSAARGGGGVRPPDPNPAAQSDLGILWWLVVTWTVVSDAVALELQALRHDSEHPAHRLEVVHAVPYNLIAAHPQVGCARERDAAIGHHPLHRLQGRIDGTSQAAPDSVALDVQTPHCDQ